MAGPLEHASQRVDKVTQVALPPIQSSGAGGAIAKANYVNSLDLQPGDVNGVVAPAPGHIAAVPTQTTAGFSTSLADVLRRYEGSPLPSALPEPSVFANVAVADLLAFGTALQTRRSDMLAQLTDSDAAAVASLTGLLNSATVANKNFIASGAVTPIGMLNLERLEMTPAGITRGDLLATIPLAPGETTSVYQKEWSVTSSEFTSIVTDSLDNYSETGVTENTDLAQSTTSQNTHNNQYNVTASASGGCGFVSSSVSANAGVSDAATQSATQSRNDAVKVTRQASTRVKQEHKMSISTSTVTGTDQSSTRVLTNPTPNAIRIDYFSMMEEWRVRLYRYGLRLTYDLTIPEPGSTLREQYAQMDDLNKTINKQFSFQYAVNDITPSNYQALAKQYSAVVPPPPESTQPNVFWGGTPNQGLFPVNLSIPQNYWITKLMMQGMLVNGGKSQNVPPGGGDGSFLYVSPLGSGYVCNAPAFNEPVTAGINLCAPENGSFLLHATGSQTFNVIFDNVNTDTTAPWMAFIASVELMPSALQTWQASAWQTLYNAAQSQFYASVQAATAALKTLQDQLNNVDTLTLRREENDEIMKGILRFLLGAWFDFMPNSVIKALEKNISGEKKEVIEHGEAFSNALLRLPASALTTLGNYGQTILFINEAIEWENLIFYLDSYFWDIPACWDFIRQIQHPDAYRQAFLRAGSARVVVPVRKGYETAWMQFIQGGSLTAPLPADSPYMTIAQQIQDYDNTNYPGIPPANPADQSSALTATTSSATLGPSATSIQIPVASSAGFIVGQPATIDTGASAETQIVTALAGGSISVVALTNSHDGSTNPFPVTQDTSNQTDSTMAATISTNTLNPSLVPVTIGVQSSAGFIAGYTALIDSGQNAESQLILGVGNASIIVQRLVNAHDGSTIAFPVAQQNEAGMLIAEWNEYTPTSGTDIAITSNLTTIA